MARVKWHNVCAPVARIARKLAPAIAFRGLESIRATKDKGFITQIGVNSDYGDHFTMNDKRVIILNLLKISQDYKDRTDRKVAELIYLLHELGHNKQEEEGGIDRIRYENDPIYHDKIEYGAWQFVKDCMDKFNRLYVKEGEKPFQLEGLID